MLPVPDGFTYEYEGTEVHYGRGRVADLEDVLETAGLERALVVCGSNVGANRDLMDPVEAGLGERHAGTFDGTTPAKSVETVYDGIEAAHDVDADVLVGVGGGSSLDIARQISVFEADGRPLEELREDAREGRLSSPDPALGSTLPVVVVPTTFAGADVSSGGSVEVLSAEESPTEYPVRVSGSVTPVANVSDPDLFETTPAGALAGSVMNGFDKGVEGLYARAATPRTHATAIHGLRLLSDAVPDLGTGDPEATERAVAGNLLVQLDREVSLVHAVGHGFSYRYSLQQGAVHAVAVPHVLRYLFDRADAGRRLLAEGLGVETEGRSDDELADAVVERVVGIRDSLDVPTRFRDLPGTDESDIPDIAAFVADDPPADNVPAGVDVTAADVEAMLREGW